MCVNIPIDWAIHKLHKALLSENYTLNTDSHSQLFAIFAYNFWRTVTQVFFHEWPSLYSRYKTNWQQFTQKHKLARCLLLLCPDVVVLITICDERNQYYCIDLWSVQINHNHFSRLLQLVQDLPTTIGNCKLKRGGKGKQRSQKSNNFYFTISIIAHLHLNLCDN